MQVRKFHFAKNVYIRLCAKRKVETLSSCAPRPVWRRRTRTRASRRRWPYAGCAPSTGGGPSALAAPPLPASRSRLIAAALRSPHSSRAMHGRARARCTCACHVERDGWLQATRYLQAMTPRAVHFRWICSVERYPALCVGARPAHARLLRSAHAQSLAHRGACEWSAKRMTQLGQESARSLSWLVCPRSMRALAPKMWLSPHVFRAFPSRPRAT